MENTREPIEPPSNPIRNILLSVRNRESNDEITKLEAELRRAYAAKELQAQLAEREAQRFVEYTRELHAAETSSLLDQLAVEEELHRKSQNAKRSEDYRRDLLLQITEKNDQKQLLAEEERRERQMLRDLDSIREEQESQEALKRKNELSETMRRQLAILQELKEIRLDEEREAEERKLLEDLEHSAKLEARTRQLEVLKEQQRRRREEVVSELARLIVDEETRKRERESLLLELLAEDVERELLIGEREEEDRRRRAKEELAASLKEQMQFAERCKMRSVERDRVLAREIMERIMQSERMERLTADARRRMQTKYREELERLIELRREIRRREIERIEKEIQEERVQEEMRVQCVKEERKRLLERHAANVGDFVKRDVLTGEEQRVLDTLTDARFH